MKRLLIVLLLIIPLFVKAQVEHAEFMGVPIDGNIVKFKKQLVKRWNDMNPKNKIKIKYFFDRTTEQGYSISCIDGFYGDIQEIVIYYDTNSGNVYEVRMEVCAKNEEHMHKLFNKYRAMMIEEYDYGPPFDLKNKGNNTFMQVIPNKTGTKHVGVVEIDESNHPLCGYSISIYYTDDENARKYNNIN